MGNSRRFALVGLAAFALFVIGGAALALPTAASVRTDPTATPLELPAPTGTSVPLSDTDETEESRKKVKPGVVFDADLGKWRAMVTSRNGNSAVSGSYDTKEEAQSAANEWANQINNGVMDGPGCDPPFVLC